MLCWWRCLVQKISYPVVKDRILVCREVIISESVLKKRDNILSAGYMLFLTLTAALQFLAKSKWPASMFSCKFCSKAGIKRGWELKKVEMNKSFVELSCLNKSCDKSCAINICWQSQPQCFHNKRERRVAVRPLDKLAAHTHAQARKCQHKTLVLNWEIQAVSFCYQLNLNFENIQLSVLKIPMFN